MKTFYNANPYIPEITIELSDEDVEELITGGFVCNQIYELGEKRIIKILKKEGAEQ